jgi:hypothetical protein
MVLTNAASVQKNAPQARADAPHLLPGSVEARKNIAVLAAAG